MSTDPISKPLLQALKGENGWPVPVWFMRQAGRYLPEYRALRQQAGGFLEMVFTPALAAEITLQPLRRFNLQAAILFSDILVIPYALGQPVEFKTGEGPQLPPIFEQNIILDKTKALEKLEPIFQTIKIVRQQLTKTATLIGFAGAPWTVACYMVEGKGSKDFAKIKTLAFRAPDRLQQLIDLVVDVTIDYLKGQIAAGAEAIQLFDSWAGLVPPTFLDQWVFNPTQRIFTALRQEYPHIPLIGFPRGIGSQYAAFVQKVRPNGVSLDTGICPQWAAQHLDCTVQGNIDPYLIVAGGPAMKIYAETLIQTFRNRPFIFNAGHGLVPQTPLAHVEELIHYIHSYSYV